MRLKNTSLQSYLRWGNVEEGGEEKVEEEKERER